MTAVEMNGTTLCAELYNIHWNQPGGDMILLDFRLSHIHGGYLFMAQWNVTMGLCHLYCLYMKPSFDLFKCAAVWLQLRTVVLLKWSQCAHIFLCCVLHGSCHNTKISVDVINTSEILQFSIPILITREKQMCYWTSWFK